MSEQQTTERAKFTPGPWKAIGTKVFGLENIVAINQDHPRHYIATVPRATGCHPPGNPDQEANARLIAAAPDLLRELLNGHVSPGGDEAPETQHPLSYTLDCIAEDIAGTDEGDWWSDWLRNKAKEIENAIAKAKGTTE